MDIPDSERRVWVLALTVYLGLDCATTIALQFAPRGMEEAPLALWFLDTFGLSGLVIQKLLVGVVLVALGVGYIRLGKALAPSRWRYRLLIPGVIGVRGAWLVVWHIATLLEVYGISPALVHVVPDPVIIW